MALSLRIPNDRMGGIELGLLQFLACLDLRPFFPDAERMLEKSWCV